MSTNTSTESVDFTKLRENLELQLAEVEMLNSMFPSSSEFGIIDASVMDEVRQVLESSNFCLQFIPPPSIEFYVKQVVIVNEKQETLELMCDLPHSYPLDAIAELYVRCPSLTKHYHTKLNSDLRTYISENCLGQLCVCDAAQWIKEHAAEYFVPSSPKAKSKTFAGPWKFKRLWLYSHHIYSKVKRRNMLDLASELRLTGFTLPGKPGIICVEGDADDVDAFWNAVKHWTWKRISLKHEEAIESENYVDFKKLRKFDNYEEKAFGVRKLYGREYTQDWGMFSKFLEDHDLGFIFKEYFGVERKT